jgi:hypothetical protein
MSSDREPASKSSIIVQQTTPDYADRMEALTAAVYDLIPRECEDCFNADHFRRHIEVFPEGQFIAIEADTDRVVGLTACMRIDFDPSYPITMSWWQEVGYG